MTIEELLQPLESEINVYSNMNFNGTGTNYIVYTEITNSPLRFADGVPLLRTSNYDIDLFCDRVNKSIFMTLIETHLKDYGYIKVPLGFNTDLQRYQITYTLNL